MIPTNSSKDNNDGSRLVIFGAGQVALPLAKFASELGFKITVADSSDEQCNKERFPMADELVVCDLTDIKSSVTLTKNDYCVIMTPGHAFDYDLQNQVLRGDFAYVGVIGNSKKAPGVQQQLREAGVSDEAIKQIHTPVGLDIKANTVEEIALAIAAELVLCRAMNRENQ